MGLARTVLSVSYTHLDVYKRQPLPEPMEVTFNGEKRTLRTVGDKWSYLQASKFGANADVYKRQGYNYVSPMFKESADRDQTIPSRCV